MTASASLAKAPAIVAEFELASLARFKATTMRLLVSHHPSTHPAPASLSRLHSGVCSVKQVNAVNTPLWQCKQKKFEILKQ